MVENSRRRTSIPPLIALLVALIMAPTALAQVSAYASGNTIHYSAGGSTVSSDKSYCVTTVVVDELHTFSNGNAAPCQAPPLVTNSRMCNWTGVHTVRAYAGSPTGPDIPLGTTTVTVTDPPPPSCGMTGPELRFDITNATAANDRRVLLSNMHPSTGAPEYPYPHYQGLLARDKVIPVNLRTMYDGAPTAGIEVVLRVIDPADPSPYMAGGPGITLPTPGSQPNDNIGALPKIKGEGVTDNGDGTYRVTSGENGYVETEMELDASARAGDNYQVVASATFPDGSTKTGTSGVVTAWKRLFIEKRNMYRRGTALATDAPVGVTNIVVPNEPIASRGVNEFRRNDFVMLMHAPTWGQPKNSALFYRGVYRIAGRPQRFRAEPQEPGRGLVTTNGTTTIVGNRTRFGALDSGDVITIGGETLVIVAVADNTHLTVHKVPSTTGVDLPYDVGDPNLIVGRSYLQLPLDRALTESYEREPLVDPLTGLLTLNDAVVWLGPTATTPGEYFDASVSLLSAPTSFRAAYTEYVVLSPGGPISPLPRMILRLEDNAQRFVDRWFSLPSPAPVPSTDPNRLWHYRYLTPPNHQLLLVGDTDSADVTQSGVNGFLVHTIAGEKVAVINRATAEHHVTQSGSPIYGADPDAVLSRTVAHEMTHQWMTNMGDPAFGSVLDDHCHPTVAYDSAAGYPASGTPPPGLKFCLMTRASTGLTMPAPWNSAQQIDMVQYFYRHAFTSFHNVSINNAPHSEYLAIRKAADPWMP